MLAAVALAGIMSIVGQVELRAGQSPPAGQAAAVTPDGVSVRTDAGELVMIGWDRIREVGGTLAAEASAYRGVSDRAWRARSRVERGDTISAEPLVEELFEFYKGRTGPSASVVAECLLRCRLRRGAQIGAVEPWLAWIQANRRVEARPFAPDWSRDAGLPEVVDEKTGLSPALPPIWAPLASLQAFALAHPPETWRGETEADRLLAWYAHAARFECGFSEPAPGLGGASAGTRLVSELVVARTGDDLARAEARAAIQARLKEPMADWMEAWCRASLGRSLIRERDREQVLLGVVQLLHVPSRLGHAHPYLGGVALAEATVAIHQAGDARGARALAREFAVEYPDHPMAKWPPLAELTSRASSAENPSEHGAPGRSADEPQKGPPS